MPVFEYKGIDSSSKKVSGTIDADSEKAARSKLRKQKIFPTKIVLEGSHSFFQPKRFFKSVKISEIANMTRQLAVLLNASIPLVDSLAAVQTQVENPILRKALGEIKEKVSEGSRLGDCLQAYPKIFDNISVSMVKAGEASGSLDLVFERLADFKENEVELRDKIKGAMTYPVIMILVAVGLIGFLFTNVIPEITVLFEKQEAALPLPTEIIIGITHFINDYWFVVLFMIAFFVFLAKRWLKSVRGREKVDHWKLTAPVFGELNQKVAVARFARTLSTLLVSGVQLLQGLDIVKDVMNNTVLCAVIQNTVVSVKEGESLAEPLRRSGRFPPLFLQMVTVGEKTGMLEKMLERVASTYDREVNQYVGQMVSLITPFMLIILGGIIFFIVMAVLMPILELASVA